MQQKVTLRLLPSEATDEFIITQSIARDAGISWDRIKGFTILKKSIDARKKYIYVNLIVNAFIDEPFHTRNQRIFPWKDVHNVADTAIIIGAGPAGLFAALSLIEKGIKPIILERGKDVKERRRDLAILNKHGIINPESNYCFGEGGAGTYSDGKLYTRSTKRGDIERILNLFVNFGASENILYEAHPHIGTNKLPQIIIAIRKHIVECGGEIHFEKKVQRLLIDKNKVTGVQTQEETFSADHFILATGHSARDIFKMLQSQQIEIQAKPFAIGVRVEHPQQLIDSIQYHYEAEPGSYKRESFLPPASYSLVQQVNQTGVFSFCMCPGGIIAPASTNAGELVVNGWSPSKRNNPFANSGIVVQVSEQDAHLALNKKISHKDPLLMMHFQEETEQACYTAGGGKFVAPGQRLTDFCNQKLSADLPVNSYLPGVTSSNFCKILPSFIYDALSAAFREFGKKMKGYYTNEALVIATESRTSSPVKIPRDPDLLNHPQLLNFYPCGEGAGYAGGIISAAMDGERVVSAIFEKIRG